MKKEPHFKKSVLNYHIIQPLFLGTFQTNTNVIQNYLDQNNIVTKDLWVDNPLIKPPI